MDEDKRKGKKKKNNGILELFLTLFDVLIFWGFQSHVKPFFVFFVVQKEVINCHH